LSILTVILCILTVIILLVLALCFIPMDIGVEYIARQNQKKSYFRIKLFKIIPIKLKMKQDGQMVQKIIEEYGDVDLEKFLKFTSDVAHTFKYIKADLKDLVCDIVRKVSFAEILFDVNFGTGNAAKTGIMTGTVWSGAAVLVRVIDEIFGVKKFSLNVSPCFEKRCFDVHFKGILRLRLVNIMIIIYKIGQIVYKFKEKSTINKEKAVL